MMPSLPQVLIIVAIVASLFGGKILRRIGRDAGYAVEFLVARNGQRAVGTF